MPAHSCDASDGPAAAKAWLLNQVSGLTITALTVTQIVPRCPPPPAPTPAGAQPAAGGQPGQPAAGGATGGPGQQQIAPPSPGGLAGGAVAGVWFLSCFDRPK